MALPSATAAAAGGRLFRAPAAISSSKGAAAHCNQLHIVARNDISLGCNSGGRCTRRAVGKKQVVMPIRVVAGRSQCPTLPATPLTGCRSAGGTVDFSSDFVDEEEEVIRVGPVVPVRTVGEDVVPAPPPTDGRIDIVVTKAAIRELDLAAAHAVLRKFVHQIGNNATAPSSDPKELLGRTVGFVLQYEPDDRFDPRELSEMPDIRLWFVRLDAAYPWLPIVLDWRAGELARYAAMLVPHQMSKRQGLAFNPEALELFAMRKVFVLYSWLKVIGISKPKAKVNDMLKMLGFTVTDQLYALIEQHPHP